jgi:hypothetical protein
MDSSSDGAAPSDSGSDSSAAACCVALAGTNQSVCDALVPLGRDRCNMLNGGTSCAWSDAASCNDGGSSTPDASADAAACCVARPGVSQSTCDAVASLGADRCNMLNGGASCMWLTGAECRTDAGAAPDAGCCAARPGVAQSTCDAVAPLGRDRCNMLNGGASCSWTCR